MMALSYVICKVWIITGSVWVSSFLRSGFKLLPGRVNGDRACLCMRSLPIPPFTGNEWNGCLHALISVWGTAFFTRQCTPLFILTAMTLMSCSLSVRIGVPLLTPSTPYPESYRSLYGTFTNLVVFRSTVRFMTRLTLSLISSVSNPFPPTRWWVPYLRGLIRYLGVILGD